MTRFGAGDDSGAADDTGARVKLGPGLLPEAGGAVVAHRVGVVQQNRSGRTWVDTASKRVCVCVRAHAHHVHACSNQCSRP
jgi:hypothetical protein